MLKLIGQLQKNKPTVLLFSGSLVSPTVYSQIECPEDFQMAAVDYCRSEGPWDVDALGQRTIALVQALALGPTVLAGYSAGGVVAMSAASQAPQVFAGLLLSNTGPCGKGHGNPHFPQELMERWGDPDFFEGFINVCFHRPVPPILKDELMAYISTVDKQAGFSISSSLRQVDYREALKSFHAPVTLAHGQDDTRRTIEHVQMMKDCMPQSDICLLPGGHTIMVENKEGWQQALNGLLQKVRQTF